MHNSGVFLEQPFLYHHNLSNRYRQARALRQPRGQQFIGQHAQMLRIILELHHIEVSVIGAHQVRLRSSAHSSYVLHSFYWHGGILAFSVQQSVQAARCAEDEKRQIRMLTSKYGHDVGD